MDIEYKTGVGDYKGIEVDKRFVFSLSGDGSNCKLSYFHQAGNLSRFSEEEKKKIVDFALLRVKGCVIINTIDKEVALFFKKTYPTYYYQELPIGYNDGFQYHICIKNTMNVHYSCKNPQPIEEPMHGFAKTKIEKSLRTYLKANDMKTKFVNSFMTYLVENK
jgi:hypothetical protein